VVGEAKEDRMRKSRFTEEKIIGVLKEVESGGKVTDVCRRHAISEQTYFRWKYGGLDLNEARRLKVLEDENRKLKQIVVDLTLDNQTIVIDNGPEFTSRALDEWAYRHRVQLLFITPGRPIENAFMESFNGKFRDECLNERWHRRGTGNNRTMEDRLQPRSAAQLSRPSHTGGVCDQNRVGASAQSHQSYPGLP
jgi:putative transposase